MLINLIREPIVLKRDNCIIMPQRTPSIEAICRSQYRPVTEKLAALEDQLTLNDHFGISLDIERGPDGRVDYETMRREHGLPIYRSEEVLGLLSDIEKSTRMTTEQRRILGVMMSEVPDAPPTSYWLKQYIPLIGKERARESEERR